MEASTTLFAALGLSPALARAASERGYVEPTAIQRQAIPAMLAGRDLLASAQTGSGKTAAFALPLLQQLEGIERSTPRQTHALVLVPTRELAAQVGESIRVLSRHLSAPIKVATVFGGVSINPQMMALRGGAEIVVATPGRLLDLIEHNAVYVTRVGTLVLDEADRLLDSGFADELQRLLTRMPQRSQTLLFSATLPADVRALAQTLLRDPFRIDIPSEPATRPDIAQRAIQVDAGRRTQLLRHLIEQGAWPRVLVFVATQYSSEHVADKLRRLGIEARSFHGDLSQGARTERLADFDAGRMRVMVATDVASRGIDIARLPVVVNYDLPRSAVDHLHRIGRTARAGASGLALSFIGADDEAHFRLIEKRQGQRVARERIEGFEPVDPASPSPPEGGVKGKRKSKKDKLREAAARSV